MAIKPRTDIRSDDDTMIDDERAVTGRGSLGYKRYQTRLMATSIARTRKQLLNKYHAVPDLADLAKKR